jgi:hypothetical protein
MLARSCLQATELLFGPSPFDLLSCQHVSEGWPMKAVVTTVRYILPPPMSPTTNNAQLPSSYDEQSGPEFEAQPDSHTRSTSKVPRIHDDM